MIIRAVERFACSMPTERVYSLDEKRRRGSEILSRKSQEEREWGPNSYMLSIAMIIMRSVGQMIKRKAGSRADVNPKDQDEEEWQ